MADAGALSLAFMRAHPAEAARVLEALEPAGSAALLAQMPSRLAAPVFAAMLPDAAARSLVAMEDERALALLGELGTQPLVAVLRQVAQPRRGRLIDGLSTGAALASHMMLDYMPDTVGSCADLDVIALPGSTRAAEALERLRHVDAAVQRVFVIAADRKLEGWVSISALLRAPPAASLASVMSRPEAVIPAQTPLAGALAHPGWSRTSLMPVLESGDRLLGAITREALARALPAAPAAQADSLAGVFARSYWDALSGGVEALLMLLPAGRKVSGAGDER